MNGENESGQRSPGADEIDRLRRLATAVKADLSRSGLVVRDVGEEPDRQTAPGGLEIDLDQVDDELGGLWLTWELHPAVRQSVREAALRQGRTRDPVIQASVDVHERTAEAIVCMLKVLGYEAEQNDSSHRPFAIRVLTGPR
ncbi:hypothetical protein [Streptomyces humi]|uniref:hypothetical protein n=1 Tax=Streptomyces humi TaxID=1428620 RepID=UPI0006287111|nr:hypothetical protein [Streptomyces humi]